MIRVMHYCFAVLLALYAGLAMAEEKVVQIVGGADNAIPIAVVPFGWTGGSVLPEDMAKVVSDDLRNSGYFEPVGRGSMSSMPTSAKEVIYRDWKADYVVVGNITTNGNRLVLQYELLNVSNEQKVYGGNVTGSLDQLRGMAHFVADHVFEYLTGMRGAFSTSLLFVSADRQSPQLTHFTLYRADYDGGNAVPLLQSNEPILSPRYSPDGSRIAYVSFEQKRPRIFLQEVRTGKREQLTDFEGLNGAPSWSPDGTRLALVLSRDSNPEIYSMNVASKQLTRLTSNAAIDTEPFWGGNGTIFFTSDRAGKPQIYKMSANGGQATRVTFQGNYNANPKLSTDEKTLVMVHREEGYRGFQIAAQDLTNNKIKVVSNTGFDDSPTVAPNGTMLIYASGQGGKGKLMLVSTNARVKVPLSAVQGDLREPSWSPYLK